ncbi:beta-ketoacyl-ACP synthase I [Opitutales bacterium ASA1]|uniref:beta-ketoacyl-[acyl-carrier-protein] synthase family protein n=1 Tax=Congregicoccus parvus TaxID=3081749 RepID=UPI002B2B1C49|nr:beta-ketoacyl-ACP synthase I [Opitutales bacterium ASA1]
MSFPGATSGRRVVVTGLGFITPIGTDRASVSAHLREGRHGLEPIAFWGNHEIPIKVAGTVKGFTVDSIHWRDWQWPSQFEIPRETLRGLAPHGVYAFCAVSQALAHAGLSTDQIAGDAGTGLYCASAGSAMMLHQNLALMHAANGLRGNPLGVVSSIAGTLNFNLAAHFRIRGAACGFASACASSSHALGYACDALRLGRLDRAIVVGAEDLNGETLVPFSAMRALSPQADPRAASRPFDAARDGFVGAGGAVAMIVETAEAADARGARPLAEIAGWGEAADGYSVATSHPEGVGLQLAMRRALAEADVAPEAVDWVCAHATSTPVGDKAEALALRALFGTRSGRPLVSSTKALTGHPLSLAGVMEAAFCVLGIDEGFVPGNPHLVVPDIACEGLELPRASVATAPRVVLNNSSGFGGSNVCHVLRAAG